MQKCQSCAMPMNKDPNGGGTNKDKSLSEKFCSFCYADGDFLWQGDNVRDYQKMVVDKMSENGWWRPIAWLATREIPRLERWKKS